MPHLFPRLLPLLVAVSAAALAAPATASAACATTDRPDLAFMDANCDGIDGVIASAIFVDRPDGDDANPGTRSLPLKTIGAAITAAKAAGKDVYVTAGVYDESLTLQTGVSVYGGYAHGFATRLDHAATQVHGGGSGAVADGARRVTLQLLTITAADQPAGSSRSSYGLRVINNASVFVEGATVRAGKGGSGADGTSGGTAPAPAAAGSPGAGGACAYGFAAGGLGAGPGAGGGGYGGSSTGLLGGRGQDGEGGTIGGLGAAPPDQSPLRGGSGAASGGTAEAGARPATARRFPATDMSALTAATAPPAAAASRARVAEAATVPTSTASTPAAVPVAVAVAAAWAAQAGTAATTAAPLPACSCTRRRRWSTT